MRLIGCGTVVALLTAALVNPRAQAPSLQTPAVHKLAATLRGSGCSVAGIESGDPTKGPSIIVEKFAPGCAIPWHWHTPNEHVMMVSGIFRFEIQNEASVQIDPGDFVLIPSHHTSQTTCLGPDSCVDFLYTDAPADIHFVDETGAEISSEQAQKRTMRKLTLNGDSGEPVLAWKVIEPHKYLVQSDLSDYPVKQDLRDDMLPHMYGLKREIDLSFLTGRELIQVAIGSFQVQFHFDEDVSVYVEAEFRYFDGQQEWIWKQEPSSPHVAARTVAMLGASITSFERSEDGTLALTFSNGHRLTILDSLREYESYQITRPGHNIIV